MRRRRRSTLLDDNESDVVDLTDEVDIFASDHEDIPSSVLSQCLENEPFEIMMKEDDSKGSSTFIIPLKKCNEIQIYDK